jgi:hypothetical protein
MCTSSPRSAPRRGPPRPEVAARCAHLASAYGHVGAVWRTCDATPVHTRTAARLLRCTSRRTRARRAGGASGTYRWSSYRANALGGRRALARTALLFNRAFTDAPLCYAVLFAQCRTDHSSFTPVVLTTFDQSSYSVRPVNHPLDNDVYFYLLVLDVEKILTNTRFICCMVL